MRSCQLQVGTDGRHHLCQSKQFIERTSSSWSSVNCYSELFSEIASALRNQHPWGCLRTTGELNGKHHHTQLSKAICSSQHEDKSYSHRIIYEASINWKFSHCDKLELWCDKKSERTERSGDKKNDPICSIARTTKPIGKRIIDCIIKLIERNVIKWEPRDGTWVALQRHSTTENNKQAIKKPQTNIQ